MSTPNKQHIMRQGEVLRVLLPGRTGMVEIDPTLTRADGAPRVRVDVTSDSDRYGPADDGRSYVVENGDPGPGVVFLTGTNTAKQYTVSGEMDPEREYITEAQALACLEIVRAHVSPDAQLYRDHEGPFWNISLEGADDWAVRISHDRSDWGDWPEDVHVEPVAGWCLGLYPA